MSSNKKMKRNYKLKKPLIHNYEPEIKKKIHFSDHHKGSTLELSEDHLTVAGDKGYRSISANYSIIEGSYYFELKVEKHNKFEDSYRLNSININEISRIEPHFRIGVATLNHDKEISLGSDIFSYAYKDIDGSIVHNGVKKPYGEKYGDGDIIGCLLHMKPPKPKFKRSEEKDEKENKIEINNGSRLYFFKNGILQGEAFSNLLEGFYYATVSLYMGAKATANFGPEFTFPPSGEDFESLPEEIRDFKSYSVIANEPKLYEDIQFL